MMIKMHKYAALENCTTDENYEFPNIILTNGTVQNLDFVYLNMS